MVVMVSSFTGHSDRSNNIGVITDILFINIPKTVLLTMPSATEYVCC